MRHSPLVAALVALVAPLLAAAAGCGGLTPKVVTGSGYRSALEVARSEGYKLGQSEAFGDVDSLVERAAAGGRDEANHLMLSIATKVAVPIAVISAAAAALLFFASFFLAAIPARAALGALVVSLMSVLLVGALARYGQAIVGVAFWTLLGVGVLMATITILPWVRAWHQRRQLAMAERAIESGRVHEGVGILAAIDDRFAKRHDEVTKKLQRSAGNGQRELKMPFAKQYRLPVPVKPFTLGPPVHPPESDESDVPDPEPT